MSKHVEPIAIIGQACRFPGADSVDELWRLLRDGVDAITEVPRDRWDVDALHDPDLLRPGSISSRWGGFLRDVDRFDAAFFGVSQLEARSMDPQQRLVLEVGWTALEHAGLVPGRLAGTSGSVFLGVAYNDYAARAFRDPENFSSFSATGMELSMVPNRLSKLLDFRGPSLAVNTGCSSSLVAVHLACQALRAEESDLALAGGVSVLLAAEGTVALSQAWMLAADGRCKAFDAAADGYVRSEGCGVVVLKRLADARRDGDRILAVIRGSAVNHGGRGGGSSAPSPEAQEAVFRAALAQGGILPDEIDLIEAHGVGTRTGDASELLALARVLGSPGEHRCLVGSVKTNIGHLEWASGIASLIKAVLAIEHEAVPRHLHLKHLNPAIHLEGTRLDIPRVTVPWPRGERPRLAGINAFGLGGTNAHVVLAEPDLHSAPLPAPERPLLLALSARTPSALTHAAVGYRAALGAGCDPVALCATANARRTHFEERAVIIGPDTISLEERLGALAEGREIAGLHRGRAARPRIAFLFTGQGSQYVGMADSLARTEPVFRETLERCAAALEGQLPIRLLDLLFPGPGAESPIHDTEFAQPALFAIEYSLATLWRSWGVEPGALLGHSVGEYVAACVAGAFTLEEGLSLIARRGRLMGSLPGGGAMVSVVDDEDGLRDILERFRGRVDVAAVNGPRNLVISGEGSAIDAIVAALEDEFIATQRLTTSHAFHSSLMDPILDSFHASAARIPFQPLRLAIASNVTGELLAPGHRFSAEYWRAHVRGTVRFADGLRALAAAGFDTFIEIGPSDTLTRLGRRCLTGAEVRFLPSLRASEPAWTTLAGALGVVHCQGAPVDWHAVEGERVHRRVDAPTYPFERQRFWLDSPEPGRAPLPAKDATSPGRSQFLRELRDAAPDERERRVRQLLRTHVAELLGWTDDRVPSADVGLFDLGLTSLAMVELGGRLQRAFGGAVTFSTTTAFTHSTLAALTRFVLDTLSGVGPTAAPAPRREADEDPIAIVGLGVRAPGGVATPEQFWALLRDGIDATSSVPRERWDADALYSSDPSTPGTMYTRRGGFLGDVSGFDAEFFGLSAREAESIDPQQRLLLEVAWEALEHAGIRRDELHGSRAGVFVGIISNEYSSEIVRPSAPSDVDAYHALGSIWSAAAGRLSYFLGLRGPSLVVDTACSSSLVSVHLACQSLRAGECDLAIAGGVNLILSPIGTLSLCRAQALAPDGRCKTFDAAADGYARAEGCGVVVLKRLSRARAEGDLVLALIRGSAMNHDGQSAGFTVPSGAAQAEVVRSALALARVAPDEIDGIEAHGTGTPLGDPIEVAALAEVFAGRPRELPLRLTSVKTAIGHLEAAAGVIGLIKTVLSLVHEAVPPHLHLQRVNPHVPINAVPFDIPRRLVPWPRGARGRLSGVSAFGMSGTNAHVVVAEAPSQPRAADAAGLALPVVITARTREALFVAAARWSARVAAEPGARLQDIAHTAALRRTHFNHRLVVVARTCAQLVDALAAFVERRFAGRDDVIVGEVSAAGSLAGLPSADLDVSPSIGEAGADPEGAARAVAMARRIVAGAPVDWPSFLPPGNLFGLPFYPWQRARHWRKASITAAPLIAPRLADAPGPAASFDGNPVRPASGAAVAHWLYVAEWSPREPVAARGPTRVIVIEGAPDAGVAVADRLVAQGIFVIRRRDTEDLEALDADVIVDIRGLTPTDAPTVEASPARTGDLLELAQALARARAPRRLYVVTRGAVAAVPNDDVDLTTAPLWGLGRTILLEHPELMLTLLDVADAGDAAVAGEVVAAAADQQVAFRDGRRLVPALVPLTAREARAPAPSSVLETRRPGFLDQVRFRGAPRRAPEYGEIEVRVALLPLSFVDVQRATGLSGEPDDRNVPLGHEWAGEVVRVGEGVTRFQPGDDAMGLAPAGVGTFLTVSADLAAKVPPGMPLERAATLPLALAVAHHALVDLARVQPGERVLIHSATGAVGQACIQLARHLGAEVLATAGDEPRRAALRAQGIEQVFDSRTVDFAAGVRAATGGDGVDVIVCSIAGAGVSASLTALRPFGRLVDIGRRTLRTALPREEEAKAPPNTARFSVDLVGEIARHPARIGRLLTASLALVAEGKLTPLVPRVYPAHRAAEALRSMAQIRHLGKVMLSLDPPPIVERDDSAPLELSGSATYLVTGGLGGLGLQVAGWLVARGARHVLLVGRRPPDATQARAIAALESAGASVTTLAADLADPLHVTRVLDHVRAQLPPLVGVLHAAGVLDDGVLAQQSRERAARVFAAKATSAFHLHAQITESLDFFVLFSSFASAIGSPGQASYAAANGALDALARHRIARGFPALSVQWGPWSEVGMAASAHRRDRAATLGIVPIAPPDALAALEHLIASPVAEALVVDVSFRRLVDALPALRGAWDLTRVLAAETHDTHLGHVRMSGSKRIRVANAPASARAGVIEEWLREAAAAVTRTPLEAVRANLSLDRLGLDSLMAVELKNRVSADFGHAISAGDLLQAPSLSRLAGILLAGLGLEGAHDEPSAEIGPPPSEWFVTADPRPEAALRLICFPFAGGGPSVFRDWSRGLPASIEVVAAQLPGRGARMSQAPHTLIGPLVSEMARAIVPLLDRPFAFFGHCMGALIMFELVRHLRRENLPLPRHLFVSASPAPNGYLIPVLDPATGRYLDERPGSGRTVIPIHALPLDAFVEVLRFLDFGPTRALLDDPALLRLLVPTVQADFEVCDTYSYDREPLLTMPLSVVGGDEDPFATRENLDRWRQETSGPFEICSRPGDHYYLFPDRHWLLRFIAKRLGHLTSAAPPG